MGLGPLNAVSLAEARVLALQARKLKHAGVDPIDDRRRLRRQARVEAASAMTFDQCVEQYLKMHDAAWGNVKHRAQWGSSLKAYASPHFGDVSVADVDLNAVLRALEPIWLVKPETASRVRGRVETILDWAKVRGLRTADNPAAWKGNLSRLLPPRSRVQKVKHHEAMPYPELPAFMAALLKRDGASALALRFTILTAARTSEVTGATWKEIDLERRIWSIPGERMKANRDHRVPLSDLAIAVLHQAGVSRKSSEYVFQGPTAGRPLSNAAMSAVLKRIGQSAVTVHGFRSSFRDWASETTDHSNEIVEMALAHTIGSKVEAAYRRGDLFDKRRVLMSDWARHLSDHTFEDAADRIEDPAAGKPG